MGITGLELQFVAERRHFKTGGCLILIEHHLTPTQARGVALFGYHFMG
jgi:hypothetical protein